MKKLIVLSILFFGITIVNSWGTIFEEKVSYRCLIQLTNYGGEGAYVITTLIQPEDDYEKTLYVGGDDKEWYPDLPSWYAFYESTDENIDGITGASIQSGGRKVIALELEKDKLNAGYRLRFESSVEDGNYHEKDIELNLSDDMIGKTIEGNGYIRYVRIISK